MKDCIVLLTDSVCFKVFFLLLQRATGPCEAFWCKQRPAHVTNISALRSLCLLD